jgi:PAS domain S-box-containing protein
MLNPTGPEDASNLHPEAEEHFREVVAGIEDYAIFLLDSGGYVASWNAGAERLKGYKAGEIIGKHFSIFYPPEALQRGWPEHELKAAVRTGSFGDEGWRLRKDGSQFWANVTITALRSRTGALRGFLKITRDLAERKRAEEALRQSEERFRLLVEGVQDYAIFMLDPGGYIASWNVGAERLKGYQRHEILGKHFSCFYPLEALEVGKPAWELRKALEFGRVEDEGWRVRKDGTRFWANVVVTAIWGFLHIPAKRFNPGSRHQGGLGFDPDFSQLRLSTCGGSRKCCASAARTGLTASRQRKASYRCTDGYRRRRESTSP